MKFKKITRISDFEKDVKKLLKRFRSLEDDLKIFTNAQLIAFHKCHVDNHGIVVIPGLKMHAYTVFKARKFACKSLKGKGVHSGIRIVYAYSPKEDNIIFIEIYYKGDQENESRDRITQFFQRTYHK